MGGRVSYILPGSRAEMDYVIYKTENFITVFEELGAAEDAKAAFDRALLAMNAGDAAEVRKQLDQSQTALDRLTGWFARPPSR